MKSLRITLASDIRFLRSSGGLRIVRSSDVIIFPELFDGGYAALHNGMEPHRLKGPLLEDLRSLSRRTPAYLIAGSLFLKDRNIRTNSSLVFHSGRVVHRYDKIHLFKPTGDRSYFSPGRRTGTFEIRNGRLKVTAGIAICYDLRFPELIRMMAVQNMSILFVPARWPATRDDAWFTLLKARAIENHAFVVGCNAPGKEGGYSYVFDPLGNLVYGGRLGGNHPTAVCVMDLLKLETSKKMHDSVKEARLLNPSGLS